MLHHLLPHEVQTFYPTFTHIIQTQFPGYSSTVVNHLLRTMYTEYALRYWLSHKQKSIITTQKEKEILGFIIIDMPYGGVSFCRWLGVRRENQHKGLGRILVQEWIDMAKQIGCHKVEVAAQPEAKDFYAKVGLELEGTRRKSYYGIDQYIFGKVIGPPRDEVMTQTVF